MDWRLWLHGMLTTSPALTALIPAPSVFAAGSVDVNPDAKPFVIFRLQATAPSLRGDGKAVVANRIAEVWSYAEPGSYVGVDAYLSALRAVLDGPVAMPGAHTCQWLGDSQELADDEYNAAVRFGTYQLIGAGT